MAAGGHGPQGGHGHGDSGQGQGELHIAHLRHGELTLLLELDSPDKARALAEVNMADSAAAEEATKDLRPALRVWLEDVLGTMPGRNGRQALYDGRDSHDLYGDQYVAPFRTFGGGWRGLYAVGVSETDENTTEMLYTVNLYDWIPDPPRLLDPKNSPNAQRLKRSILSVPLVVDHLNNTVLSAGPQPVGAGYMLKKVAPNWLAAGGNG